MVSKVTSELKSFSRLILFPETGPRLKKKKKRILEFCLKSKIQDFYKIQVSKMLSCQTSVGFLSESCLHSFYQTSSKGMAWHWRRFFCISLKIKWKLNEQKCVKIKCALQQYTLVWLTCIVKSCKQQICQSVLQLSQQICQSALQLSHFIRW